MLVVLKKLNPPQPASDPTTIISRLLGSLALVGTAVWAIMKQPTGRQLQGQLLGREEGVQPVPVG